MEFQTDFNSSLGESLDEVKETRDKLSTKLAHIVNLIDASEVESAKASGSLELGSISQDLLTISDSLKKGVFRLLVLGDMKRGKSTFLNALLGEDLLPRDVNPCTAVLTTLRYSDEGKEGVTIYFNDGKSPQVLSFSDFKSTYTIPIDEASRFAEENREAFPDVEQAVIYTSLPLLKRGIEIIDSPGLNDTEKRDELTLTHIRECHAILFVVSATQPWTRNEERYLETYILNRGLTVFFLINMWDEIARRLDDPDDKVSVAHAEEKIRAVFRSNLEKYCNVDGVNIYDQRVFEISALKAFLARRKNQSLDGTGFVPFTKALEEFLIKDRAAAEFGTARAVARSADRRVREAVDLRIPLLYEPINELERKITEIQPKFDQLRQLRDEFIKKVNTVRDRLANELSNSFYTFFFGFIYNF
ncbi:dynamin family protein [Spirosoma foliorum]|uniref:Dynamin family protein n=1 Tax=Spirosoma foliorum TaxID=2710596 RepID=A0A7G5GRL5_9BACT|nr:dynamin family protein [Spirosoma foliorum]QMW01507.1 dynamin family protein [Spirosoma foliorum]